MSAGVITDQYARMSCERAGITPIKERKAELEKQAAMARQEVAALEGENTELQFMNSAWLAIRLTKAACDSFMAVAGLAGGQAKVLADRYGAVSENGEMVGKVTSGTVTVADAAKFGMKQAVGRLTPVNASEVEKRLSKIGEVKYNFVVDAMNQDKDALIRDMIALQFAIASASAEWSGKGKVGDALDAAATLIASGLEVHSAWTDYQEIAGSLASQAKVKDMIQNSLRKIQRQIDRLDFQIKACAVPSSSPPPLTPLR